MRQFRYDIGVVRGMVLSYIRGRIVREGLPPTVPEITRDLRFRTHSTVWFHLANLREQGLVDWTDGKQRTLRLTGGSSMGILWIIAGPSGSGRNTLAEKLASTLPGLALAPHFTTHPSRTPGRHLTVSGEWFESKVKHGEFLYTRELDGERYGITQNDIQQRLDCGDAVVVTDGRGIEALKRSFPTAKVIFMRPADTMEMRRRLANKVLSERSLEARMAAIDSEATYELYANLIVFPGTPDEALAVARSYIVTERVGELVGTVV